MYNACITIHIELIVLQMKMGQFQKRFGKKNLSMSAPKQQEGKDPNDVIMRHDYVEPDDNSCKLHPSTWTTGTESTEIHQNVLIFFLNSALFVFISFFK